MNILVVEEECVAVVAFVLAEGLAMIAQNDPQRLPVQASRAQAVDERAQRSVAIVKGVPVLAEFVVVLERAGFGSLIRVMAGNRQIGHEERLTRAAERRSKSECALPSRLIHAEAGVVVSADVARICERLEATVADNRLHPQIHEAARMEQRRAVSAVRQNRRHGPAGTLA